MIIIKDNKQRIEELEIGMVVITTDDSIFLVIETESNFYVYDMEGAEILYYNTQEHFEEDYTVKEVYKQNEIKVYLSKN